MLSKDQIIRFLVPLISFVLVFVSDGYGQRWKIRRYEIGIGTGTAQVFGDIGGTASSSNWFGIKDIKFDETRMAFNIQGRYKVSPRVSAKGTFNLGFGKGTDANSKNDRGRSYSTTMYEFSGHFEYFFLAEDKKYRSAAMYNKRGMVNNYSSFAAYGFAGLGVTFANSKHGDAVVFPYDDYRTGTNVIPVLPFGVGIKYILDEKSYINGEFGYRFGFTDYIDGYKQTKSSKFPDVYYFLNISYNYRLKTTRRNIPAFLDRRHRMY